jgi:hypothetical protein
MAENIPLFYMLLISFAFFVMNIRKATICQFSRKCANIFVFFSTSATASTCINCVFRMVKMRGGGGTGVD